jgi:hypothetical protein
VTRAKDLESLALHVETMIGPGDLCQHVFISCADGFFFCPGNCHCEFFGSATGLCINNWSANPCSTHQDEHDKAVLETAVANRSAR